jgi:hypothetical protein
MFCLCAEQWNNGPVTALSRRQEQARLAMPLPPPGCRAFFVEQASPLRTGYTLLDGFYLPNIDAMVLATRWGVPTVNGISSWFPDGWALEQPAAPAYLEAVHQWAKNKGLAPESLCGLDMLHARWRFPAFAPLPVPALAGQELQFATAQPGVVALRNGWSQPEAWGVWSDGGQQGLQLRLTQSLHGLRFRLQAFRAEQQPLWVTVRVPGNKVLAKWHIQHSDPAWYSLPLVAAPGVVDVQLEVDTPRAPAQWEGTDKRQLGIGLIALSAEP